MNKGDGKSTIQSGRGEISGSTKRLKKIPITISVNDNNLSNKAPSLLSRATQLRREMKILKEILNEANEKINKFKLGIESKLSEPVTCKNCYKKYTLLENPSDSCRYHPGKVKYFSCKVCGGDEYYTCCRVCRKCDIGCHTGQHAPVIRYSDLK